MTRHPCTRGSLGPVGGRSFAAALFVASSLLCTARVAHAEEQDAAALKAASSAIDKDYMGGKFAAAQRKLEKALKSCGKDGCSAAVQARLYRDLGVVYIGGLGKPKEGREALARAVQADPAIRLQPDLTTPEIAQTFREVGGSGKGGASQEEEEAEEEVPRKRKSPADVEPEEPREPGGVLRNWLSLTLQQDFFLHSETRPVCYSAEYTCFGVGGVPYQGPIYEDVGNRAEGGLGLATTRVLLGFDRLFLGNLLIGGRVGFAFNGSPPGRLGAKFLPLHVEVRGAYFFGGEPFQHPGFRPYAALGIGVAEVDARIGVEYFVDEPGFHANQKGTLDAWRKTGKTFFAPSVGSQYTVGSASALTAELRLGVMLGASGLAPAIAIGYTHGL